MIQCRRLRRPLALPEQTPRRGAYPDGINYLVASDVDQPMTRRHGNLVVRYVSPRQLIAEVIHP